LPFKIEFSEAEMAAIASLPQPINRKEQQQNQKERLKNEQNIECRMTRWLYAAGSSQDSVVLSAKPEQALLSKSASFAAIG